LSNAGEPTISSFQIWLKAEEDSNSSSMRRLRQSSLNNGKIDLLTFKVMVDLSMPTCKALPQDGGKYLNGKEMDTLPMRRAVKSWTLLDTVIDNTTTSDSTGSMVD